MQNLKYLSTLLTFELYLNTHCIKPGIGYKKISHIYYIKTLEATRRITILDFRLCRVT